MLNVVKKAIGITSEDTNGIHLSFDIDVISPSEAPDTGTSVPYGITAWEALPAVKMISKCQKLVSVGML